MALCLAGVAAGVALWVWFGPTLPPESDAVVAAVLGSELPELVAGTTGTTMSGPVEIWYEDMSPPDEPRGTVLLIMGLGVTAMGWPPHVYEPLLEAGYRVIRYDNRGLGRSDWMPAWSPKRPYTLEDMAEDGIAVLDECRVDRAHVVGISMGGMIGQRLAVSHADRVESLTSIASAGYMDDPSLPGVSTRFQLDLLRLWLRYGLFAGDGSQLRLGVGLLHLLQGDDLDEADVRGVAEARLYELRRRRGDNPDATTQHGAAVVASGSRYSELPHIGAPTLVVHGASDPLVRPIHAETYAPMIPGARLLVVEGMGHYLPARSTPQIVGAMLQLFAETD